MKLKHLFGYTKTFRYLDKRVSSQSYLLSLLKEDANVLMGYGKHF